MTTMLQDLRFVLRQLRRAPGFAAVAILTLALAVGISTSVFSVIDATVLRPLPYTDPDRIVMLQTYSPEGYGQPASWPQYLDWRHGNATLSALAGFEPEAANLQTSTGTASPVHVVYGTDNFFDVFAVHPLLGRTFSPGEDQPGKNDVAVLSYELWQGSFGGRKDIVGSTIKLDGTVNTVVGVMPAGFRFPLSTAGALYRPFHIAPTRVSARGSHWIPTIARLKPGISLDRAQADLNHVFDNIGRAFPDEAGRRVRLLTATDATLGDTAPALRVLSLAVFGVLLIGCVNLAGLLLARGIRRQREFGLRSAIGAGRARLVRQLLTEAAILSLAGAAVGVVFAAALLQLMRQLLIHSLARGADVHLNLAVLAATVAIALATGLVAGVVPAWQSAHTPPALALRSGGGGAGTSRAQGRVRAALIITQVAVALGLLVSSSLLLRNLRSLLSTDLGFSPQNLLTEELFLNRANYTGRDLVTSFYGPLLDRVRAIPGVTSAGVIDLLPIQSYGSNSDVSIVGHPPAPLNQANLVETRVTLPGTLETFGSHLVEGRTVSSSIDRHGAPLSVNVNQAFVRHFFSPGEDPLGKLIQWGPMKVPIVGVTSDIRQALNRPPMPELDATAASVPDEYAIDELAHMNLVVRSSLSPATLAASLREVLHQVDPTVPFRTPETMREVLDDQLTLERLESWLFGTFAALALLLSLVGIYGTVAHEVELRTRDIGVRMALGSTRARVVRGILTRVATLMLGGVVAGWALTLALRRVLASVVELHPAHDFALLAAITAVLTLAGLAASLLPARRAATIDPIEALRTE